MNSPTVSYIIATHNRRQDLKRTIKSILNQDYPHIEIVVISNGSSDGTCELFKDDNIFDRKNIVFLEFDDSLGVSRSRNIGFDAATGDILVSLDDDAVVTEEDATEKIVTAFSENDSLGILSFKIFNHYTGSVGGEKIPTTNSRQSPDKPFKCAYFLGGGNAIRSEVIEDVGAYPPEFRYGFEELDLSYRALDAGFSIQYLPTVSVEHYAEPKSEGVDKEIRRQYLTNRTKVAIRNLPPTYAVISTLLWIGYTLLQTRLDPRPVLGGIYDVLISLPQLLSNRSSIDKSTVKKINRLNGRLWK